MRFFLPPKLEDKLVTIFDPGHMETFRKYFEMLDVDSSGDLTDKELRILLEALDMKVTDKALENLISTVDLNGNGTIEYDEFCWMMYEMARTDKAASSTIFGELKKLNGVGEEAENNSQTWKFDLKNVSLNMQNLSKLPNGGKDVIVTENGDLVSPPPPTSARSNDSRSGDIGSGNLRAKPSAASASASASGTPRSAVAASSSNIQYSKQSERDTDDRSHNDNNTEYSEKYEEGEDENGDEDEDDDDDESEDEDEARKKMKKPALYIPWYIKLREGKFGSTYHHFLFLTFFFIAESILYFCTYISSLPYMFRL